MKVGIIGSGYVGKAAGMGLYKKKHDVTFHDVNIQVLEDIARKGFKVEYDLKHLVENNDIFFISVPTPSTQKGIDLSFVRKVFLDLNQLPITSKVFILKSTVIPGTTRNFSVYFKGKLFFNPEFLQESTALDDFINPDRVILGYKDKNEKHFSALIKLFKPFKAEILCTTYETAEMIKYVSNCFFSTRISYFNQFKPLCKKLKVDLEDLRYGVMLGKYFGKHPWKVGKKFSGNCLPKDIRAMIEFMKSKGEDTSLLESVERINEALQ